MPHNMNSRGTEKKTTVFEKYDILLYTPVHAGQDKHGHKCTHAQTRQQHIAHSHTYTHVRW